jgi:hypothetical protein
MTTISRPLGQAMIGLGLLFAAGCNSLQDSPKSTTGPATTSTQPAAAPDRRHRPRRKPTTRQC